MPDYPEIFVLRHGQTEWNTVGRHQGRLDSPLTEIGREQALAQSRILANALAGRGDVQAHCSPQGRAFDTAGIILCPAGAKLPKPMTGYARSPLAIGKA